MTDYNLILPSALPEAASAATDGAIPIDNGSAVNKVTPKKIVDAGRPFATQSQAEAGTDATVAMSPLTTKQAIEAVVPAVVTPFVELAEAWAESPTPPNPGVPDSKSAKSWADDSKAASERSAKNADRVKPQFDNVVQLISDTTMTGEQVPLGSVVWTPEGAFSRVSTGGDITTDGGLHFIAVSDDEGFVTASQLGLPSSGSIVPKINAVLSRGYDVMFPSGSYALGSAALTIPSGRTVKMLSGASFQLGASEGIRLESGAKLLGEGQIVGDGVSTADAIFIESGADTSHVVGVKVSNCAGSSIHTVGSAVIDSAVVSSPVGVNRYAIYDSGSGNVDVLNCVVSGQNGNGIYFNGQFVTGGTGRKRAFNNVVHDISHSSGTGEYGNGIHAYRVNDFEADGNVVYNTSYTPIRAVACERSVIRGGSLRNPGIDACCVYSEFAHRETIVSNINMVGGGVFVPNAESSNGKVAAISNLTIVNGYVFAEAQTAISSISMEFNDDDPIVQEYDHAVLLGYGNTCRQISVTGVNVRDTRATPKIKAVVAALYNSGNVTNRYDVSVSQVSGRDSSGSIPAVAGHKDRVVINTSGVLEPIPDYVSVIDNSPKYAWSGANSSGLRNILVAKFSRVKTVQPFVATSALTRIAKYFVTVYGGSQSGSASSQGVRDYIVSWTGTATETKGVAISDRIGAMSAPTFKAYYDDDYYYIVISLASGFAATVESKCVGGLFIGAPGLFNANESFDCVALDAGFIAGLTDDTANWPQVGP